MTTDPSNLRYSTIIPKRLSLYQSQTPRKSSFFAFHCWNLTAPFIKRKNVTKCPFDIWRQASQGSQQYNSCFYFCKPTASNSDGHFTAQRLRNLTKLLFKDVGSSERLMKFSLTSNNKKSIWGKKSPSTFDFGTMYACLQHKQILKKVRKAVQEAHDFLSAKSSSDKRCTDFVDEILEHVDFVVNNTYLCINETYIMR